MPRSRPFSIFLLKEGRNAANSLRVGHGLVPAAADSLPEGSTLFILDTHPTPPWWRAYFGIHENLLQVHKGALVFLPIEDACFALAFGQVIHHLEETAFEYDFGLRVTLNSLDPKKLKSADMLEPGAARRRRTQVPKSTELTYLDFDANSDVIKSLTGKVKDEYEELFKNATGSVSLKVNLKLEPHELPGICETLLELYESDDYKEAFPNIQNIVPVKDPLEAAPLDAALLRSVRENDGRTTLTIPDIVDYRDNTSCIFFANGESSNVFPDISIEHLYEFLEETMDIATLSLEQLKSFRMMLTDVDGSPGPSFGIFRSLIFETESNDGQAIYHINEGSWYKVEREYLDRLRNYLDAKCEDSDLCPYNHDAAENGKAVYSEENYNSAVPAWSNNFICLDQTDISPAGSTAIEPCDIYTATADQTALGGSRARLYHIKISTRSSQLSHLFNQGLNSIELIAANDASREKMRKLVRDRLNGNNEPNFLSPIDNREFKVVFGIITHKDRGERSNNLPLFSKISLMRNMQRLELMKVPVALTFIEDRSPKKSGHPKHPQIEVEVHQTADGKVEVRPRPGQGADHMRPIKGCPRAIKEAAIGSRYRLTVKSSDDGELSSYHGWPFELVA